MIPKRIIQTHISELVRAADRATWVEQNPGFEYCFSDNAQFYQYLNDRFPELSDVIDMLPLPVMVADIFRYVSIYENGGMYADVDTRCLAPIESYIDFNSNHFFLGAQDTSGSTYSQWVFASPAGHPLMGEILDTIVANVRAQKDQLHRSLTDAQYVLGLTGPVGFSNVVRNYLMRGGTDVTVLPVGWWTINPIKKGHKGPFPKVIHLNDRSWFDQ